MRKVSGNMGSDGMNGDGGGGGGVEIALMGIVTWHGGDGGGGGHYPVCRYSRDQPSPRNPASN